MTIQLWYRMISCLVFFLGYVLCLRACQAPITIHCSPVVNVEFQQHTPIILDVEAGETSAAQVVKFTVSHSVSVKLIADLMIPAGIPAGLKWDWGFVGFGGSESHEAYLYGSGTETKNVKVHVKGVTINTPAGEWPGGRITISAIACL